MVKADEKIPVTVGVHVWGNPGWLPHAGLPALAASRPWDGVSGPLIPRRPGTPCHDPHFALHQAPARSPAAPCQAQVITGFLGAGKTTLINYILTVGGWGGGAAGAGVRGVGVWPHELRPPPLKSNPHCLAACREITARRLRCVPAPAAGARLAAGQHLCGLRRGPQSPRKCQCLRDLRGDAWRRSIVAQQQSGCKRLPALPKHCCLQNLQMRTVQSVQTVQIIENEYGEVGIDDALVLDTKEEIFGGCCWACCPPLLLSFLGWC